MPSLAPSRLPPSSNAQLAENATREPLTPTPRGSGASTALRVSGVRHLDTRTDEESTKRRRRPPAPSTMPPRSARCF